MSAKVRKCESAKVRKCESAKVRKCERRGWDSNPRSARCACGLANRCPCRQADPSRTSAKNKGAARLELATRSARATGFRDRLLIQPDRSHQKPPCERNSAGTGFEPAWHRAAGSADQPFGRSGIPASCRSARDPVVQSHSALRAPCRMKAPSRGHPFNLPQGFLGEVRASASGGGAHPGPATPTITGVSRACPAPVTSTPRLTILQNTSAPGGIRTPTLRIRNPALSPVALRAHERQ